MSRIIIGLIGEKGSGKSTTAEYIAKNMQFKELYFAERIKKIAEIMGFPNESIYGTQKDKAKIIPLFGISFRQFAQYFGGDIMREDIGKKFPNWIHKKNIWVNLLKNDLKINPKINYVVSDVRYLNEAKMITEMGGVLVRINRKTKKDKESDHLSEIEMKKIKCDYEINNNSTIYNLQDQILFIISKIVTKSEI